MYKLFYIIYGSKKWQNSLGIDICFEDLENPKLFKKWFLSGK